MNIKSGSRGFTLVEVLVSVALITTVVVTFIHFQIERVQRDTVEALSQDILSIANAATSYYINTNNPGWPGEAGDCVNLLGDLVTGNAFPDNYETMAGVSLGYNCEDGADIGRVLKITATFPAGSDELADMLLSYLPTSSRLNDTADGKAVVVHYVAQPRRAAQRYEFQRVSLTSPSVGVNSFTFTLPDCAGSGTAEFALFPQAVCNTGSQYGLAGFHFAMQPAGGEDTRTGSLMVSSGPDSSSITFDYAPIDCSGTPVEIGVITWCD